MAITKRRYLAYMLRLWQVKDGGLITWRASLEDPHTGELRGFESLAALIQYLLELAPGDASPKVRRAALADPK